MVGLPHAGGKCVARNSEGSGAYAVARPTTVPGGVLLGVNWHSPLLPMQRKAVGVGRAVRARVRPAQGERKWQKVGAQGEGNECNQTYVTACVWESRQTVVCIVKSTGKMGCACWGGERCRVATVEGVAT